MVTRCRRILGTLVALAMLGCPSSEGRESGAISCADRLDDWWRVSVSDSTAVTIRVDTVRASTAFDPGFQVYEVTSWSDDVQGIVLDRYVGSADDDFECRFAPSTFECPLDTYEVETDFLLAVENLGSCRGTAGEYALEVFGADSVTYLGSEPR